ncbi:hypothetical protein AXF42_Ash021258 [Apostasia shenzhenica]|uniref:Pre-mRNA polyadenylation factor Fip1 domain-containing protein n=1 Tax=Apostasia shenzhenica TaxID=1088818 RepID=A0A2H9ZUD9_9ASPA|nr:hypothetical protein AXF42_Ash021258 [Apostasia shenzhenica]
MEEDDDFGDLYTDVIRPTSVHAPPTDTLKSAAGNPVGGGGGGDVDDVDCQILPASSRSANLALESYSRVAEPQVASVEDADDDWLLGRDPLPVEEHTNWADDDEEVMVARPPAEGVVGFLPTGGGARVLDIRKAETDRLSFVKEADTLGAGRSVEKMAQARELQEEEPVNPGRSLVLDPSKPPNGGQAIAAASDDWDSDSEDDLQIVLNDTRHGPQGADVREGRGSDDDDEDGEEDLVIVTDEDQHHRHHQAMEEQDWTEDAVLPAAEGDKKDVLEGAKANGASAITSGTGIGYNNHSFHQQHHSMFKYVRPGAIPTPGGSVNGAAGVGSQVYSPGFGPMGRGRGDWRPAAGRGFSSMQKGFHSGYGLPAWGNSLSTRPFGVGLDFTLPSYKTVFDVDIESFEEKPWRHPGVDISDFFNFGLDEEHWKEYYKQVEQLRVESTMQGKIRVYESGRSQQDFDPDLPPELAAATSHQDMTVDNTRFSKADNGQVDINCQGSANMRPPLPTGRAIQVEGGYGERLPSVDTRPPRLRDSDSVIEIVLQGNLEDSTITNGSLKQPENNIRGNVLKGFHDVNEVDRPAGSEYHDRFPSSAGREPLLGQVDGIVSFPLEPSHKYDHSPKAVSPEGSARTYEGQYSERSSRGTSHGRISATSQLNETVPSQIVNLDKQEGHPRKSAGFGIEGNLPLELSPSNKGEIMRESSLERREGEHEDRLSLGDSHDVDGDASDYHVSSENAGEDGFTHSPKRQKSISYVEQPAVWDNGDGDDDSRLAHSDDSRAKSGNTRDYQRRHRIGEEDMQAGRSKRVGDLRKHHEEDEHIWRDDHIKDNRREMDRNHSTSRGRENMHHPYPHKDWDSGAGHSYRRNEVFDKEMDTSVSVWQRREDDNHIRRIKDENVKRGRNEEIVTRERSKVRMPERNEKTEDHQNKRVDDGDRRVSSRDRVSRHWERDDFLMSRREILEDTQSRRKRDDEVAKRVKIEKEDSLNSLRAREDSSRRKRGRDDIGDHRRRDDDARTKSKSEEHHSGKHKDDSWYQREREDRHRLKLSHDDSLVLREREEKLLASKAGRPMEEKSVPGSGRTKDPKVAGSDRDHHHKDRRRHNEQQKKANRISDENDFQNKVRGETNAREKRFNSEEGSMKHERSSVASDGHVQKERQRESGRKIKDPEHNVQNRETSGKRKHEDLSSHHIELKLKGASEEERGKHSSKEEKKDHWYHKEQMEAPLLPAPNHGSEDPASDDEHDESRRGRSKLERWASHKERDYNTFDDNIPSSSSVAKHVEDSDAKNPEDADMRASDAVQVSDKAGDERERHLDTVAKLRMRSERFKLPMPSEKEKDLTGNKKVENETSVMENEVAPTPAASSTDMDIKPERPARKRRWTGS